MAKEPNAAVPARLPRRSQPSGRGIKGRISVVSLISFLQGYRHLDTLLPSVYLRKTNSVSMHEIELIPHAIYCN